MFSEVHEEEARVDRRVFQTHIDMLLSEECGVFFFFS